MRHFDLNKIIEKYGNITLAEYGEILKEGRKFVCPKCNGRGKALFEIPYPSGLPDSGFVPPRMELMDCDVCQGIGFTEKELKPKTAIIGYE